MCPHPIYRVFLQVRVITALFSSFSQDTQVVKKRKCTLVLFSECQLTWKAKLKISKGTTDPGIEWLIECCNSLSNFWSNFSLIITQFHQYLKKNYVWTICKLLHLQHKRRNLGQTSVWFGLAEGEKYMQQLDKYM